MKIFYLFVIGVIILNQIWILYLLHVNQQLREELQEVRKNAIKEINKLRNGDKKNDE